MSSTAFRVLSLLLALLTPAAAHAALTVSVDLSAQSMVVAQDGEVRNRWAISSGRIGYRTPNGAYRPQRLERMHYSRKYGMAPMPHSIFFRGGYAIHGTSELRRLGRTASHGCIRLSPGNAAELYSLVQAHGRAGTRIVITGSSTAADGVRAAPRSAIRRETPPTGRIELVAPRMRSRYVAPRRFYDPYEDGWEAEPYSSPTYVFPRRFFDLR